MDLIDVARPSCEDVHYACRRPLNLIFQIVWDGDRLYNTLTKPV